MQRAIRIRIFNVFVVGVFATSFGTFTAGCGGESGDGVVIEGTLAEAGGAGHSRQLTFRHEEGQRIGEVRICALDECSETDDEGQWGFLVGDQFSGGEVLFTIQGHGVDAETVLSIPSTAREVFLDFQHVPGGTVEAQHITVDGETQHLEPHGE